ncbi:MAG: trypsin-like peptidase domain-containing protein [Clostridia bacterium]|nr:trypsin-like peptidase domain-containing protein [Clostridia bacterium]
MKKRTFILLVAFVLLFNISASAASNIRVYVNGMRFNGDIILQNDRTFIPLRAVSEALGANVEWDEATNSAFITFTEDDAIAKVVENVSPCVVTIVGIYDDGKPASLYNNPTAHGSGVIYKSNGYILTNAHVVENLRNLTVILNDGTSLPGQVLYSDETADLAVVKIEKIGLKPIAMAQKETVLSGKTAIAIGTPISLSMRNTVTKGIVCGTDVSIPGSYYKLVQTDATINPGNSGGPLLNTKGELIGINSSKFVHTDIDNVGFAIPIDTVQYTLSQFEQHGQIVRPDFTIDLEQSWEARIGLPTQKGITVKSASVPELLHGDEIKSVNGIPVHSITDWNEALKQTYNGESFWVTLIRNGESVAAEIKA